MEKFTLKDFEFTFNNVEFQREYLFKIWLPNFTSQQYDRNISVGKHMHMCTSSTMFPSSTTSNQTVAYYNSEKKIATKTIYQPFQVTFKFDITSDFSDFSVANGGNLKLNAYQYFDFWRNSVFWEIDRVSSIPSEYQKKVSLMLLNNLGEERYEFELENAWPSSISGGNLSYSSESITNFVVEFTFDRFIFWNYSENTEGA